MRMQKVRKVRKPVVPTHLKTSSPPSGGEESEERDAAVHLHIRSLLRLCSAPDGENLDHAQTLAARRPRRLRSCPHLLDPSAYYSKNSYEGDVTFTGMVQIADDTPDFLIMPSFINRQLLYLAGPLQAAPKKAAAKSDGEVEVLGKYRDS